MLKFFSCITMMCSLAFANGIIGTKVLLKEHAEKPSAISAETFPPPNFTKSTEYTLPDLHANTLKFLKALIILNYIEITKENYLKITRLYDKDPTHTTREDIQEIKEAIQSITVTKDGRKKLLRLIGDEFADRGANDYYTLLLIQHIMTQGIQCEFILSNHGYDFLKAYEKRTFYTGLGDFGQSLASLRVLLKNQIVTTREISPIVETFYKPNLKVLSYSLSKDQKSIYIYTHAGAGLHQIQLLAAALGVRYNDSSAYDLAKTIDTINQVFQKEYIQKNKTNSIEDFLEDESFILWNRDYQGLNRPAYKNDYNLYFIHGHDPNEQSINNIYNIDTQENNLGKSNHPKFNEGYLIAFEFIKEDDLDESSSVDNISEADRQSSSESTSEDSLPPEFDWLKVDKEKRSPFGRSPVIEDYSIFDSNHSSELET